MDNENKTCGNCKFKGEPIKLDCKFNEETWEDGITGFFKCDLVKQGLEHSSFLGDTVDLTTENPIAFVQDGSGYFAALCVSADFGCNQWEEK